MLLCKMNMRIMWTGVLKFKAAATSSFRCSDLPWTYLSLLYTYKVLQKKAALRLRLKITEISLHLLNTHGGNIEVKQLRVFEIKLASTQ